MAFRLQRPLQPEASLSHSSLHLQGGFFFAILVKKNSFPTSYLLDLPCDEANGRDGSALLSMGLDPVRR